MAVPSASAEEEGQGAINKARRVQSHYHDSEPKTEAPIPAPK